MEVKEAIETRRSVHYYDSSKKISDAQWKELFRLVALSPSGYNLQPWEFIVIRDQKNKEKLKECAMNQQHVADASAAIVVVGNLNPAAHAEKVFSDWVAKGYFNEDYKKKVIENVKNLAKDKEYCKIWTTRSTCLAAMTLMIAAKDMGFSTCPMEGFSPEKVKEAFGIPDGYMPLMIIALGYESKPQLTRLARRQFEEIVHLEKF